MLVLEPRERLGGACTLERPFADERYVVSPCAYVVGLLDELVIPELELNRRGLEVYVADPNLWVPFDDGTAFGQWMDDERTVQGPQGHRHQRSAGRRLLGLREVLRRHAAQAAQGRPRHLGRRLAEPRGARGDARRPDDDRRVFDASIADVLDDYVTDQRLKDALFGQGVIGTFAGPRDPGTASIKLMHYQGDLLGEGPVWGYVRGGMGMVSFAIADAAQEAGAVLAAGVPVAEIVPGEGVTLEDGTLIPRRTVVCNADPKRVLGCWQRTRCRPTTGTGWRPGRSAARW